MILYFFSITISLSIIVQDTSSSTTFDEEISVLSSKLHEKKMELSSLKTDIRQLWKRFNKLQLNLIESSKQRQYFKDKLVSTTHMSDVYSSQLSLYLNNVNLINHNISLNEQNIGQIKQKMSKLHSQIQSINLSYTMKKHTVDTFNASKNSAFIDYTKRKSEDLNISQNIQNMSQEIKLLSTKHHYYALSLSAGEKYLKEWRDLDDKIKDIYKRFTNTIPKINIKTGILRANQNIRELHRQFREIENSVKIDRNKYTSLFNEYNSTFHQSSNDDITFPRNLSISSIDPIINDKSFINTVKYSINKVHDQLNHLSSFMEDEDDLNILRENMDDVNYSIQQLLKRETKLNTSLLVLNNIQNNLKLHRGIEEARLHKIDNLMTNNLSLLQSHFIQPNIQHLQNNIIPNLQNSISELQDKLQNKHNKLRLLNREENNIINWERNAHENLESAIADYNTSFSQLLKLNHKYSSLLNSYDNLNNSMVIYQNQLNKLQIEKENITRVYISPLSSVLSQIENDNKLYLGNVESFDRNISNMRNDIKHVKEEYDLNLNRFNELNRDIKEMDTQLSIIVDRRHDALFTK